MASTPETQARTADAQAFHGGTTGRATRFEPKNWWPDHIKPSPTSFIAARHRTRMWKL
jgi:hypothetical protein